jgi:hypothetical protein
MNAQIIALLLALCLALPCAWAMDAGSATRQRSIEQQRKAKRSWCAQFFLLLSIE